jgi:hypothetical protein
LNASGTIAGIVPRAVLASAGSALSALALADQEHPDLLARAQEPVGHVVGGLQVSVVELDPHPLGLPLVGVDVEGHRDRGACLHPHLAGVGQLELLVGAGLGRQVEVDAGLHGVLARVVDRDEHGRVLAGVDRRADVEAGDPQVGARAAQTDEVQGDLLLQGHTGQGADLTVGEHVEGRVTFAVGDQRAHPVQRAHQAGGAVRGLEGLDRAPQHALGVGQRGQHRGVVGEGDDDGAVAVRQVLDHSEGLSLGALEAGRARAVAVAGQHAGRAVDQEHRVRALEPAHVGDRAGQGQDHQQQDQRLNDQHQVHAQALERRIDPHVVQGAAPQVGAGDRDRAPLELEEVEDQQQPQEQGRGQDPTHTEELEAHYAARRISAPVRAGGAGP